MIRNIVLLILLGGNIEKHFPLGWWYLFFKQNLMHRVTMLYSLKQYRFPFPKISSLWRVNNASGCILIEILFFFLRAHVYFIVNRRHSYDLNKYVLFQKNIYALQLRKDWISVNFRVYCPLNGDSNLIFPEIYSRSVNVSQKR